MNPGRVWFSVRAAGNASLGDKLIKRGEERALEMCVKGDASHSETLYLLAIQQQLQQIQERSASQFGSMNSPCLSALFNQKTFLCKWTYFGRGSQSIW